MSDLIYIPIKPRSKAPLVSDWSNPTVTPEEVQAWWEGVPEDCNKALRLDDFLVIDCDTEEAAWYWMTTTQGWETNIQVATPKGIHFYYRLHPTLREHVKAGPLKDPATGKLLRIDVKCGPGHYVLVPPSVNADGVPYRWI